MEGQIGKSRRRRICKIRRDSLGVGSQSRRGGAGGGGRR
jgi:hypothetical protein